MAITTTNTRNLGSSAMDGVALNGIAISGEAVNGNGNGNAGCGKAISDTAINASLGENGRHIQVAVLSLPRNGTYALHRALGMLGYSSYHFQLALDDQRPDMSSIRAALEARRLGRGARFTRADWDKFLGPYNAIVEVPAMMDAESFLAAHPHVPVILTTRDPAAWVRSYQFTIMPLTIWMGTRRARFLALFSRVQRDSAQVLSLMAHEWTGGLGFCDAGFEHMIRFYEAHNAMVRRAVPPERLLELKLEDGRLGWDEVCRFLGREMPTGKGGGGWPSKHSREEFEEGGKHIFASMVTRALMSISAIFAPAVAVLVWVYLK